MQSEHLVPGNICVDQISEKPPKSSLKRAGESLQIGQKNTGPNEE